MANTDLEKLGYNDKTLFKTTAEITASGSIVGSNKDDSGGSKTNIASNRLGDLWIKNFIRSENWKPKTTGFTIDGQTGYAEFSSGWFGSWNLSSGVIYYDGATDALSSGMSPLDYPFYAGKKYAERATAPFRVTTAGVVYAANAIITGGTINGVAVSNVAKSADDNANAVPTELTVSSTGITTAPDGTQSAYVVLSWTANTESNFDHYYVRYGKNDAPSYQYYDYIAVNNNTIKIDGLTPNTSYVFGVSTVNKYGIQSAYCTNVISTTPESTALPPTVLNVVATGGIQCVVLTWDSSSATDLASYDIYRHTSDNSAAATPIGTCRTTNFVAGNLTAGTYYFWVKARNTSGKVSANFSDVTNASAAARNVGNSDVVNIAGSKILIDGTAMFLNTWFSFKGTYDAETSYKKRDEVLYNDNYWNYINDTPGAGHTPAENAYWTAAASAISTIDGDKLTTGTVTLSHLNFTPVQGSDVIASINASTEGGGLLKILAKHISIDGNTDFASGYDPTSKVTTFAQDSIPTSVAAGDIWIDTNDDNKTYRAASAGADQIAVGEWILLETTKVRTFAQDAVPTSINEGDIWYDTDDNNKMYRADIAGADQITAGEWVAVPDNNKLNILGGSYDSDTGEEGHIARVRIFPNKNTGIQIIDDAGNDVFKAMVGGTSVGDIIFGDYAHDQGMFYDKNVGDHGTTYVKGALIGGAGSVFSADYFTSGKFTGIDIELVQSTSYADSAIIDSYDPGSTPYALSLFSGNNAIAVGQSFTNSNLNRLNKVKFYIKRAGTPTGNITATIYAHTGTYGTDGKPTGAVLATSDAVDITTITDSAFVLTEFVFSGANEITLDAGTKYIAVINFSGGDSGSGLGLGLYGTSPIHSGNVSYSANLSSWSALSTDYDVCFYVYGEEITTGDCAIRAGKTDFDYDETGFIMGVDASDSNKVKFIIGTPTEYLAVLGDTFVNTLRVGGYTPGSTQLIASDAEKSDTTLGSPTTMKQIRVGRDGTYRVSFQRKAVNTQSDSRHCYWQLNKTGTWNYQNVYDVSTGISGYGTLDWQDMIGINPYIDIALVAGQSVYLMAYADGGVTGYVRNFKFKVSALNEVSAPSVIVA